HVSCLKRRLRMIVRAKTPRDLSWPGRIAVLGLAALLLPLAPSWAQSDPSSPPAAEQNLLVPSPDEGSDAKLALAQDPSQAEPESTGRDILDTLIDRLVAYLEKGLSTAESSINEKLEDRISDKLMKDPGVVALNRELERASARLEDVATRSRQSNDPARFAAEREVRRLTERYTELLNDKERELRAQLEKDKDQADKDAAKADEGRESAERLEVRLKDLIENLGNELGPVGEEIRKAVEQAVRDVHEALKKEGVSVDDLRKALEKSHDDLRGAIEKGGSVNEEARKAIERSAEEVRKAIERSGEDVRKSMEQSRRAMR